MMKEFVYRIKNSKILLVATICCAIMFILDFSLAVFDIVELVLVSKNAANLSAAFLGLNIAGIVVNIVLILLIVALIVSYKFVTYSSKEK